MQPLVPAVGGLGQRQLQWPVRLVADRLEQLCAVGANVVHRSRHAPNRERVQLDSGQQSPDLARVGQLRVQPRVDALGGQDQRGAVVDLSYLELQRMLGT